jgi:hypothetical protein
VLRRFLEQQDTVPWDALNYVTGHINYGGRVTDDWDRRCLMSILSIYMVPDILEDSYAFSSSGTYFAPKIGGLSHTVQYFESLPQADDPEVFGMHENANVTFNTNESLALMSTMLSLQVSQTQFILSLSVRDVYASQDHLAGEQARVAMTWWWSSLMSMKRNVQTHSMNLALGKQPS